MNRRRRLPWAILLLCVLALAGNALAMSSDHYGLDWFTPLTGSGGGPSGSAHYAANVTLGQTAIGPAQSAHYATGLGYWYGVGGGARVYLPLVVVKYAP
jgi:hypothetical protein